MKTLNLSGWAAASGGRAMLCLLATSAVISCGGGGTEPPQKEAAREAPAESAVQAPLQAVHRFANTRDGGYFYTASEAEKKAVLQGRPDMRYEGVAFAANELPPVAPDYGAAVYRFANLAGGGYFYTASPQERDFVQQTRPDMRYEGATFAAAGYGQPGSAVYRLANLRNGAYLYTRQEEEVRIAESTGHWRNEGVAFLEAAPPLYESIDGTPGKVFIGPGAGVPIPMHRANLTGLGIALYRVMRKPEDAADIIPRFPVDSSALFVRQADYFDKKMVVVVDGVVANGEFDVYHLLSVKEHADRIDLQFQACSARPRFNIGESSGGSIAIFFALPQSEKSINILPPVLTNNFRVFNGLGMPACSQTQWEQ